MSGAFHEDFLYHSMGLRLEISRLRYGEQGFRITSGQNHQWTMYPGLDLVWTSSLISSRT